MAIHSQQKDNLLTQAGLVVKPNHLNLKILLLKNYNIKVLYHIKRKRNDLIQPNKKHKRNVIV
jgi:hypothetical protein